MSEEKTTADADVVDPMHPWGLEERGIICAPIWSRLPTYALTYRTTDSLMEAQECGEPAYSVTAPWDEILCHWKELIVTFPINYLICETAQPNALDWLAQLVGFTGIWWDVNWPEDAKRVLICNALKGIYLWENRGTLGVLDWLLKAFKIKTCPTPPGQGIYTPNSFFPNATYAPETTNNPDAPAHYIRLEQEVERVTGREWKLAEYFVHHYGSVYNNIKICYCYFYPNKSLPDDPVFSWAYDHSHYLYEPFIEERGGYEGFWADPFNWYADLFRLFIHQGFGLADIKVIPGCVPDHAGEQLNAGGYHDVAIEPYIPFWICLPISYHGRFEEVVVNLWELVRLYAVPLFLRFGANFYDENTVIFEDKYFRITPESIVVFETFYSGLSYPVHPFLICGKSYRQIFP